MAKHSLLKDKTLALFFTTGVSLKLWHEIGMIDREVAIYNELSKHFKHIYFFTYGGEEDLGFKDYLADNITVLPRKYLPGNIWYSPLYSLLMPFIYFKIFRKVDILKTNQMSGSWAAVLAKIIYRKRLLVRTGFMLSIHFNKRNPKSRKLWLMKAIERLAYRSADGIITTSQTNFDYVTRNYHLRGVHTLIPNYVETDRFKPMPQTKPKGSICFVGRLTEQKNLFALLEALSGLPYNLSLIGSGEQEEELKRFAAQSKVRVSFLGNVPNQKLPEILNEHELFVLPSRWEGMPKTLLEVMACGLPVVGTNIDGTRDVIKHGENGILCETDATSIREAITLVMEDGALRQKLGRGARQTIEEGFSLKKLVAQELSLLAQLSG